LAVDLAFDTSERQPPQLWHLPKNYLDLLGSTGAPPSDPGALLYRDDRQVKLLFASVHHGWERAGRRAPSILISARTRTDALYVMDLASRLAERRGSPRLGWQDDPFADDLDTSREDLRTADVLWRRGDVESRHVAEVMRHHVRRRGQEALLSGNDDWLTTAVVGNARRLLIGVDPRDVEAVKAARVLGLEGGITPEVQATFARRMLTGLNGIALPPLPTARGQGASFKTEVDRICAEYVADRPGLFPLVVPLRVTVLVVPPDRDRRSAADLDNVLIRVLGAVDAHMKPPISPWLLGPLPPPGLVIAGRDARDWKTEGLERAKSLGSTSVWAYQILELARLPTDPPGGQVMLVLGNGMNHDSLWGQAANYVREQFERDEDELADFDFS
jgi:hypothetical protein